MSSNVSEEKYFTAHAPFQVMTASPSGSENFPVVQAMA